MNSYTVLAILLCIAVSNARNFEQRDVVSEDLEPVEGIRRAKDHTASQRHKRRSWHTSYGYEYPQPPIPFYHDRRDYEQQSQQDLLPQIWRLLDEISAYIRRPPPPPQPQPIYIPYAVPYPIPQTCKCVTKTAPKDDKNVSIDNRFKDMEDEQNWGLVNSDEGAEEEGDGSRPISFVPLVPKRPSMRPSIKVEHGSQQAGVAAPIPQSPLSISQQRLPSTCEVFSLSCCTGNPEQRRKCFTNVGCGMTYDNGNACDQEKILAIIDAYSKAYSPVQ